jgi:hypothetical protein
MTALELATLTLQLLVPTVLIGRVALVRRRDWLSWALDVTLAAAYLGAIALAGLWLALPRSVVWALAVLLGAAAIFSARHGRPGSGPRSPRLHGVGVVVRGALAAAALLVAGYALLGRRAFDAPAVDLAFPLRAGTYLIAAGGSNALLNPHVQTLTGARYAPYRGQSYALDVVAVGGWGSRTSSLSPDDPAGFTIFGDSIHAPCSGTVVKAEDGRSDQRPTSEPPETLEGNHVILDCGGVWVVMAHMLRGSVEVDDERPVRTGDLLGRVGNSGRSDEPHLHIHAQTPGTESAPLLGDPLPITFDGRRLVRNDRVHATPVAISTRSSTSSSSRITRPGGREP